jgi:hypothetical protein
MLMAFDLQNFLSPKILPLHMREDLLSKNSWCRWFVNPTSYAKDMNF